ncbi:MAG: hypothetical protein U0X39_00465 [Bacteroidales bacterium]
MKKWLLISAMLALSLNSSLSQELSMETISSLAEELAEGDETSAGLLEEMLSDLIENPVNINSPDPREIGRLFFLTEFQVKSIIGYVKETGAIQSLNELQVIPGFSKRLVAITMPFIITGPTGTSAGLVTYQRHRYVETITFKSSDREYSSTGSPLRILGRYKFKRGNISAGFTTDKDPGEAMLPGNHFPSDFYSGYVSYSSDGFLRNVIAGDFSARFGAGAAINTSIRVSPSLTANTYMAGGGESLRPYTSADESNFFRGLAIQAGNRNTVISAFLSSRKRDAITGTSEDGTPWVSNIISTGYHRSSNEISRREGLGEISCGINLTRDINNLRLGILYTINSYSLAFISDSNDISDMHSFTGKKNQVVSAFFRYSGTKTVLSGELAANNTSKHTGSLSFQFRPDNRFSAGLLFKYSAGGFNSMHGKIPGITFENFFGTSITGNLSYELASYLFLEAGTDLVIQKWPTYRCSSPYARRSSEIRLSWLPPGSLTAEFLYSRRDRFADQDSIPGIPFPALFTRDSYRIRLNWAFSNAFSLSPRFDYKTSSNGEKGYLLLQNFTFRPASNKYTISFSYCIFNTDSFETAIYTRESDLPGTMAIPALFGKGQRTFFMFSWKPAKSVEMRMKVAFTGKSSSASNDGVSEVRFQIRLDL